MFKALLVISLAYAVSAQYNYNQYYVRPLSYEQAPVMPQASMQMNILPMSSMPTTTTQEPRRENPCTEEVLRSPEIQAFVDPLDRRSYIVCTEVDVFVRMPCAEGTFFDSGIRHCVPDGWVAPVCPVGLCKNNADCIIDELKNEYKCLCRVGFTGLFCETNIDECAMEGNAYCRSQNGQCVDQVNAYYCDFGDKIGLSQETAMPKPCTLLDLSLEKQFFKVESPMDNVYLQCTGENRWIVSKCAEMLFWNQELRTCSIEQPVRKTGVCNTYPCKNDGVCEDTGNYQFTCSCRPGFEGALCEEVIDYCLPQPCGSGRCVSHPGGYNCVCNDKVVDQSCDNRVQNPCTSSLDYASYPLDSAKYFSCGLEGFAFVKTCAPGTMWENNLSTCMAVPQPKTPPMSIFAGSNRTPQSSYGSVNTLPQMRPVAPMTAPVSMPMPATQSSYGSVNTLPQMRPVAPMTAPVSLPMPATQSSYGSETNQQEMRPVAPMMAPEPMPMPATQSSYGSVNTVPQMRPVVPMTAPVSQMRPVTPAPVMNPMSSYTRPSIPMKPIAPVRQQAKGY